MLYIFPLFKKGRKHVVGISEEIFAGLEEGFGVRILIDGFQEVIGFVEEGGVREHGAKLIEARLSHPLAQLFTCAFR